MTRRIVEGLLAALLLLPFGGGVAAAHDPGGVPAAAVSLPRVLAVDPPVQGLSVVVVEAGARLRIDNGTGGTVQVLPPDGVPRTAEPVVPPGGWAAWSDPRLAEAPPAPPAGAGSGWTVPLDVDGRAVTVRGDRVWPAPPPAPPWWALTLAAALATISLGCAAADRGPRSGPARAIAVVTALVGLAHATHVLGAALVLAEPPGAGTVLAAAGIGVACWLLAATGAGLALFGRPFGLPTCATAGALAALLTVFDTTAFHRAVLPFAWAFDLDRLTTVVTVGGGLGLLVTGAVALHRAESASRPPGPTSTAP